MKNLDFPFFAKMAAKTTSGSGFLFRFVFSTLDLVDLAQNLKKNLRDTFSKILGQKLKKIIKMSYKNFLLANFSHFVGPMPLNR